MDKLQWGNRKLLRRLKLRGGGGGGSGGGVVDKGHDLPLVPSPQLCSSKPRKEEKWSGIESEKASNLKEKKSITTIINVKNRERREKKVHEDEWGRSRRLMLSLSSKEKEEDFMKMKGCKPSQRPKKRAKAIQHSLLSLSPGAWLWDVCLERYQVREKKKTWKKKPSGLKAMELGMKMKMDSD